VELGVKLYQSSSLTALIAAEYGEPFTVNVVLVVVGTGVVLVLVVVGLGVVVLVVVGGITFGSANPIIDPMLPPFPLIVNEVNGAGELIIATNPPVPWPIIFFGVPLPENT
jgi:hypothetical protein